MKARNAQSLLGRSVSVQVSEPLWTTSCLSMVGRWSSQRPSLTQVSTLNTSRKAAYHMYIEGQCEMHHAVKALATRCQNLLELLLSQGLGHLPLS